MRLIAICHNLKHPSGSAFYSRSGCHRLLSIPVFAPCTEYDMTGPFVTRRIGRIGFYSQDIDLIPDYIQGNDESLSSRYLFLRRKLGGGGN